MTAGAEKTTATGAGAAETDSSSRNFSLLLVLPDAIPRPWRSPGNVPATGSDITTDNLDRLNRQTAFRPTIEGESRDTEITVRVLPVHCQSN